MLAMLTDTTTVAEAKLDRLRVMVAPSDGLGLSAVDLEELILAANDRAQWADPDTRARLARGRVVLERELVRTLSE